MKAILSKLNAAGIKDLFLNRWELVIVGIAGLFALTAVAGMTDWQGFDRTPTKLETEARSAQAQLGTTAWPDTEKEQFKFVSLSQQTSDAVFRPLPLAVLEYSTAMSQKMYPKLKPRDEAQFVPVEDLIAEAGTFVLETVPEQPEMPEGGEAPAVAGGALAVPGSPAVPAAGPGRVPGAGAPAMAAHAAAGPVDPAAMMMAGGGMMGADGMMGTITGGAGRTGRGVRYVAVRGVLPYRVQLEKLSRALNLDTKAEARDALNYVDFEIERQRAIPGPNPWPEGEGAWEAVDTQVAVDLLTNEAANWDAELVAPESTDAVFTMPLPTRIEGPWTPEEASHPRLERLTAEEIEAEAKRTAEALAKAKADAEAESGPKKGFGRIQRDINRAMAAPGMDMMMPADGMMAPGMGAGMPGVGRPGAMRGGAPMHGMSPAGAPPGMGRPGGMVPGSPAMAGHGAMAPGMGMGMGMQGMGMGGYADIKPRELVLFRYFDTVVEPGAAYRYRVRLKALNPNFQYALDQVAAAAVAEGEFRFTDWSEPTAPVVVPKDTVYTTNKVPRRQGRPENKAELAITHWFSEKGTLVSHTVTNVYGQLVGGKVKTKLLDIGAPSLEETEVTIRGSEVLLDSLGLAGLASSVNTAAPSEQLKKSLGELGIDKNSWNKMLDTGELELSVVVNRAGEIVINDTLISRPEKQEFDKEYKAEQDKYKDLLEAKPAAPANGLDAYMADGMMAADPAAMAGHGEGKGKKKKGRSANPARMGGSMMAPGMMAPGMMAPGMAPGMVPGSPAGPAGKKSKK
jgi:hypothetical protein